ncbi:hypothetical protein Syun_024550 [Stephania yunnanensis]|uniref:Amidohydrolase-related domain-containing protein n=1 Tax=Stephania yunnanensis TaxID=152371 RepID=A0AAP0I4L6_9MAGN
MALRLSPLTLLITSSYTAKRKLRLQTSATKAKAMATKTTTTTTDSSFSSKIIDSHLHVWASPEQAANEFPYFPGNEPTLPGTVDFLFECMKEAGVDGALIVQPINHKFDHSLVTSVLKKYPSKFVGCLLANPAEDGSGIQQLENLILKDGYRAVRFNPYLWPSSQKMTNDVGKALFAKAGELGAPVGFMCMQGLNMHISEIEELCLEFPSTTVLLDHVAFCKPPITDAEKETFSLLLKLSRFPQVYVKFSALFRVTRRPYPYEDTSDLLSEVVSSYGANRVMWGSDFPYVVPECGYKGGKEAVVHLAGKANLPSSDVEWIVGRTVMQLFPGSWKT